MTGSASSSSTVTQESTKATLCAEEVLRLLNCVASNPNDYNKCVHLLSDLSSCIRKHNVERFSLRKQEGSGKSAQDKS